MNIIISQVILSTCAYCTFVQDSTVFLLYFSFSLPFIRKEWMEHKVKMLARSLARSRDNIIS